MMVMMMMMMMMMVMIMMMMVMIMGSATLLIKIFKLCAIRLVPSILFNLWWVEQS